LRTAGAFKLVYPIEPIGCRQPFGGSLIDVPAKSMERLLELLKQAQEFEHNRRILLQQRELRLELTPEPRNPKSDNQQTQESAERS
jgi:hypothetical protein